MKGRLIRGVAATTLLTTAVSSTGCGYFLYPERRGNSGNVDAATLVMDLLWLIPGVVPGVVALIVDFSSGAIYRGHGRYAVRMSPRGHLAVHLPDSPSPAQLQFRLVTSDHRILVQKLASVGPSIHDQSVELQLGDSVKSNPNETIYLEVVNAAGAATRFPASMEVAR